MKNITAYEVSANGIVFGTYASDSEQGARDLCARDAGYESEADMVDRLDQPSELKAREVEAPMNHINLEQWSQSHETAEEIAEAIFSLARSPEEAERIWLDPTREEWLAIWERVTKNGLLDGADFQWGVSAMGNEYPNA